MSEKEFAGRLLPVSCIEIEVAIMSRFDFRRNLIVPNISSQMGVVAFETDMLVLTKSGYAEGFEIKVSKSDLNADFKKRQYQLKNQNKFYEKFKYFNYAVPEQLKEYALEVIPSHFGLWVYRKVKTKPMPPGLFIGSSIVDHTNVAMRTFYCARSSKKISNYKWSESEMNYIARLGAMRIYSLKKSLLEYKSR